MADAPPVTTQLSIPDFAAKIKSRDSRLSSIPDDELVRKTLERRPELIKYVRTMEPRPIHKEKSLGEKGLEALPMVGATVGGIVGGAGGTVLGTPIAGAPGAVAGATIGGAAGKAAEQLGEKFITKTQPLGTSGEAAKDISWEAIKQGAYELGGRAIGAIGGRAITKALGRKAPAVGETIKDITIPESAGQAYGKKGGIWQTAEHYISKTFLGRSLRNLQSAQEDASRKILAKLSGVADANPAEMAANWAKAREATRAIAQPVYESFGDVEGKSVAPVAAKILKNDSLRLSPKAVDALGKIAADPMDEIAKGLGYQNVEQAVTRLGPKVWEDTSAKILEKSGGQVAKKVTIGDALQARHELGDMAAHAKDPNDRRLLFEAWGEIDKAIDKNLSPAQIELKKEADTLWRRSYLMDKVSRGLGKIESGQDPKAAPKLAINAFTKMVNGLAKSAYGRDASGKVIKRASEMDVLFDNPSDRKAMIDLASFLSSKYSTMTGAAGLSETVARVGVALGALRIPYLELTGQQKEARKEAGYLAGLYIMSSVLANPGGAKLVFDYFKAPASEAGPIALRMADMIAGGKKEETQKGPQGSVGQTVKDAEDLVDQLVIDSGGSKASVATAVQ
jgi:hypothetical protein